jgi:hypothetical protein
LGFAGEQPEIYQPVLQCRSRDSKAVTTVAVAADEIRKSTFGWRNREAANETRGWQPRRSQDRQEVSGGAPHFIGDQYMHQSIDR